MALLNGFLSRISSLVNQVSRCLGQDQPSTETLRGFHNQLQSSLEQLSRIRGTVADGDYTQLRDDLQELQSLAEQAIEKAQQRAGAYKPATVQGRRGAPKYNITSEQLTLLLDANFTIVDIANILQVSVSTIERRMRVPPARNKTLIKERAYNLHPAQYSQMSDAELDAIVRPVVEQNKNLGYRAVRATLQTQGYLLKYEQVRQSILRVDPAGVALRWGQTVQRRTYHMAAPNSMWHIDGNHKLIRWKMVIHGGVDGYSRHIVFLSVSHNNRSSTVFRSFFDACVTYGVPARVRSDYGGENVEVAHFMLVHSGTGCGSIITGASTHNQRVERFWRDLFTGCTQVFYDLFQSLEENGELDLANDVHVYALHYVFLPRVQIALAKFAEHFNNHPIRTEHNLTPRQLFISGALGNHRAECNLLNGIFLDANQDDRAEAAPRVAALENAVDNGVAQQPVDDASSAPCPLTPAQLTQLKDRINPLDDIEGNGRTLYLRTVTELNAMLV